jgi:hypothetical protein
MVIAVRDSGGVASITNLDALQAREDRTIDQLIVMHKSYSKITNSSTTTLVQF